MTGTPGDADGEGLRRRLYRPGADGGDVAAYLAVHASPVQEAAPAQDATGRAAGSRPRRSARTAAALASALLVVLVVLVCAGSVAGLQGAGRGSGAVTAPARTPLPASAVDRGMRGGFVGRVQAGRDAGLAAWWGDRAPSVEAHGIGSRTVVLPPRSGSGGMTVLLVLGADATAGWTVSRLVIHDDRTIHLAPLAGATGSATAGVPVVGRIDRAAVHQPARLRIEVPAGVPWGAAVVDAAEAVTGLR